jgi:hypothetical protein
VNSAHYTSCAEFIFKHSPFSLQNVEFQLPFAAGVALHEFTFTQGKADGAAASNPSVEVVIPSAGKFYFHSLNPHFSPTFVWPTDAFIGTGTAGKILRCSAVALMLGYVVLIPWLAFRFAQRRRLL